MPRVELERRVEVLEQERDSLDFREPLALRVSGGLLLGGSALTAVMLAIYVPMERQASDLFRMAEHDNTALYTSLAVISIIGFIGAMLTLGGAVIHGERERERRRIDLDLAYLREVRLRH